MNATELFQKSYIPTEASLAAAQCSAAAPFFVAEKFQQEPNPYPQVLQVRHNGATNKDYGGSDVDPIYFPAYYYLLAAGSELAQVEQVMDSHSVLKVPEFEPVDIYNLSLSEIETVLVERLHPWYALANTSLNSESEHGFNKHGLVDHIQIVARNTVALLQECGYDENIQKIGLIMAYGHDLGNVLTRKFHSLSSPYILEHFIPELTANPDLWKIIVEGIQLHNEPVARAFVAEKKAQGMSTAEAFQSMHPAALALIVRDKQHVGPIRLSEKVSHLLKALNSDPHFAVNLVLETTESHFEHGVMTWNMNFMPTMSTEEQKAALNRSNTDEQISLSGDRFVTDEVHMLHHDHGIPHLYSIDRQFWQLYFERNILAIQAMFALAPTASEFRIIMHDGETHVDITHTFKRDEMDQQIYRYGQVYLRK